MNVNQTISEVMIRVGRNVRKRREEKGLTQQEIAFYCDNMDRGTLSKLETFNSNGFNLNTIVRISVALKIDVVELFEK
jgi:transcriptional regulator with XRE-family HTH domain